MRLPIERKFAKVYPDMKRVIIRYFFIGDERCRDVIGRVMALSEEVVFSTISPILQEYSDQHRNITQVLNRHFAHIHGLLAAMGGLFAESYGCGRPSPRRTA